MTPDKCVSTHFKRAPMLPVRLARSEPARSTNDSCPRRQGTCSNMQTMVKYARLCRDGYAESSTAPLSPMRERRELCLRLTG